MRVTAIYDACVLFPAPLRDLLIRIAAADIVRARWTEEILDECFRAILRNRKDLNSDALSRTRSLLIQAVPDCIVKDYEHHIPDLHLPDDNDRHVLAAAIACKANIIVTANLGDFPDEALCRYSIRAQHPDLFVCTLIDEDPFTIAATVTRQAASLRRPSMTIDQLLTTLAQCGLHQSVAALRELCG